MRLLTLTSSMIAISCAGLATPSFAQDEGASDDDNVIVVTGIRGALDRATELKRAEAGVVDIITAEDIGKFPDTNLAESLQRVTGVSIDRQNNEGNQITVRGLGPSFNLVTLNGRQMPVASSPESETVSSSTQSRAFNFAEIAAESVSGVYVFKTSRADLPTGGIGATVDIRTARPFDLDPVTVNLRAAVNHDFSSGEGTDEFTPEFGGLASFTFGDGRFGLLVNGSYSKREFEEQEERTDGWFLITQGSNEFAGLAAAAGGNPTQFYRPITHISEISYNERERINAQFVAQAEPVDGVELTFDYTLSRFDRNEQRFQTGVFGDTANHGIQSLTVDENGTFTNYAFSGAADFLFYDNELRIENDSFGGNLKIEASDNLTLEFDGHTSKSESQPDGQLNDLLGLYQTALGVNFAFDYGSGPFQVSVDDSGAFRGQDPFGGGAPIPGITSFLDPDATSPLGTFVRTIAIRNDVDQAQFKGTWEPDSGFLSSLDFGASYTDYQVSTAGISSGFIFQGLGADPTFPGGATITVPCSVCNENSGFFTPGGGTSVPGGFPAILRSPDPRGLFDSFFFSPDDIVPQVQNFDIQEESLAFYANFNFEGEVAGMPARAAVGVRYETTDVTGTAFQNLPVALQTTSLTEQVVINSPDIIPFTLEGDYDQFLPAIDLQIEPRDDMLLRLSYGRTIARPDLNALRPSLLIAEVDPFGPFNAFQGNPDLQPFLADNVDLAFEWYFAPSSLLAVNYFYKNVSNFIGTRTFDSVLMNANGDPLTDPSARFVPAAAGTSGSGPVTGNASDPQAIFAISQPFNEDESATINGLEIAVQHVFDFGVGFQLNYTFVDSGAEFDPNSLVQQVVLLGLSDSANAVLFYENDKFQVRVAANYRDEFLFSTNQLRVPGEPVFFDDYIQVDASASYDINDNFSVFVDVLNIFGEDQRQRGRFENQFLFQNDQEPRITFGARASF